MRMIAGLDLGDFRTRVCWRTIDEKGSSQFRTHPFKDPSGSKLSWLPSIVQINHDDTVSYGHVDSGKCKVFITKPKEPQLVLVPRPEFKKLVEPTKPQFPRKPGLGGSDKKMDWKDKLKRINNPKYTPLGREISAWEAECEAIERKYNRARDHWLNKKHIQEHEHAKWLNESQERRRSYELEMRSWMPQIEKRMLFTNFKSSSFHNTGSWKHDIETDTIMAWYMAYLIFCMAEEAGSTDTFVLNIGIPGGIGQSTVDENERKVRTIISAAYKLVEFYGDLSAFMSATYTELLDHKEEMWNTGNASLEHEPSVHLESYAALATLFNEKSIDDDMRVLLMSDGGGVELSLFSATPAQFQIHTSMTIPIVIGDVLHRDDDRSAEQDQHDMETPVEEQDRDSTKNRMSSRARMEVDVRALIHPLISYVSRRKQTNKIDTSQLYRYMFDSPIYVYGRLSSYKYLMAPLFPKKARLVIDYDPRSDRRFEPGRSRLGGEMSLAYGLSLLTGSQTKVVPIEQYVRVVEAKEDEGTGGSFIYGITDT